MEQFWLAWAEFQDESAPVVLPPGPNPSECPTCAVTVVALDVQSLQVSPVISLPSAVDPVRMSCSLGVGEPVHWPLIWRPRSSTNSVGSPVRAWSSVRSRAIVTPLALIHGPLPMRLRASVGWLALAGSRSTLR